MSGARIRIRHATETLSRIAIANVGSTAYNHQDPSWLWPPPLHQPYCRLHFLRECSKYHLRENESFKRMVETRVTKLTKLKKRLAVPTRIQPARRARERTWKDHSGVPLSNQNSSPAQGEKIDPLSVTIGTWHQQLHLHLPWPIFKTKIEAEIEKHTGIISRDSQLNVSRGLVFECRYCKFNPEVIDSEGSAPRKLAPPAPMHFIRPSDMKNTQTMEFGGLKFAVDLSDGHETIVLLVMDRLEDIATDTENAEPAEQSTPATGVGSKKRSLIVGHVERDELADAISKRPKRKGG